MKKFIIVGVLIGIVMTTTLVSKSEDKSKEILAKERLIGLTISMEEVASRPHKIVEYEMLYDEWYAIYKKYPHFEEFNTLRGSE